MNTILKDPASPQVALLGYASPAVAVVDVTIAAQGYVPGGAKPTVVPAISAGMVQLTIDGGSDGELYLIIVRADLGAAPDGERQISVMCLAKAWAMPNVGASAGTPGWIDLHEFIERFGLDETISATAVDAGGGLDKAFLVAKLQDAQAEAEANVAAKYALPLAEVPAILKTAVADLARARLYRRGVPEEVAENAKIQRKLLERISNGSLPLPLPTGSTAAEADSGIAATGWSGERAYPDGLKDY